jgi:SAM-dependent methyltransferase
VEKLMNITGWMAERWRNLNNVTVGTDTYWWISLSNAAFYEDMKGVVTRYSRGRTLDIGAGRLAWRKLLHRHVTSYISGDIVVWHEDLDLAFDATGELPFPDETFDTIFCCSVLEHDPEPWDALFEMHRILAPRGRLLISVPFLLHLHDEPHDYHRFTRYGLECLAARSGFTVHETIENGSLFHFLLNPVSIVCSLVWSALHMLFLINPTTRCLLAVARQLDRLVGARRIYASNIIAVLEKEPTANHGWAESLRDGLPGSHYPGAFGTDASLTFNGDGAGASVSIAGP